MIKKYYWKLKGFDGDEFYLNIWGNLRKMFIGKKYTTDTRMTKYSERSTRFDFPIDSFEKVEIR